MTAFCVWTLISLGTIALGAWLYQQNFVIPPGYKLTTRPDGFWGRTNVVVTDPNGKTVGVFSRYDPVFSTSVASIYRLATRAANKHYRYTYQREDREGLV